MKFEGNLSKLVFDTKTLGSRRQFLLNFFREVVHVKIRQILRYRWQRVHLIPQIFLLLFHCNEYIIICVSISTKIVWNRQWVAQNWLHNSLTMQINFAQTNELYHFLMDFNGFSFVVEVNQKKTFNFEKGCICVLKWVKIF